MVNVVTLIQTSRYRWHLVSAKGKMLVDDLMFADEYRAELWVKAYISSFLCWDFELKPLQGTKK